MTKQEKESLKALQRENGLRHKQNLIDINALPPERQKEIRQKAAAATNEIKARKRNIKEICEAILSLDGMAVARDNVPENIIEAMQEQGLTSIYDVIVAKQAINAVYGSTKAAEYIRDSNGDRPTNDVNMDINVITESDRALLDNLSNRIEALEAIDTTS